MTQRQLIETTSDWLDRLAWVNSLPIEADDTREYVRFGDLTFTAPLSRILGGEKPASDEKDAA